MAVGCTGAGSRAPSKGRRASERARPQRQEEMRCGHRTMAGWVDGGSRSRRLAMHHDAQAGSDPAGLLGPFGTTTTAAGARVPVVPVVRSQVPSVYAQQVPTAGRRLPPEPFSRALLPYERAGGHMGRGAGTRCRFAASAPLVPCIQYSRLFHTEEALEGPRHRVDGGLQARQVCLLVRPFPRFAASPFAESLLRTPLRCLAASGVAASSAPRRRPATQSAPVRIGHGRRRPLPRLTSGPGRGCVARWGDCGAVESSTPTWGQPGRRHQVVEARTAQRAGIEGRVEELLRGRRTAQAACRQRGGAGPSTPRPHESAIKPPHIARIGAAHRPPQRPAHE